jgi:hypothetical protein
MRITLKRGWARVPLLARLISMTANPSFEALSHFGAADVVAFMVRTFIQLVGEELLTILPLLAVLWFCVRKLRCHKPFT